VLLGSYSIRDEAGGGKVDTVGSPRASARRSLMENRIRKTIAVTMAQKRECYGNGRAGNRHTGYAPNNMGFVDHECGGRARERSSRVFLDIYQT
jgi:hypothetical protein